MPKINKSFIIAALVKLFSATSGFFLTLLVTRFLSSDSAGAFLLCLAIVTVISYMFRMGFDNIILRVVSSDVREIKSQVIVKYALKKVIIFSVIGTITLLIFKDFLATTVFNKIELSNVLLIFLISIPFISISFLISQISQGLNKLFLTGFFQNLGISVIFLLASTSAYFVLEVEIDVNLLSIIYLSSAFLIYLFATYFFYKSFRTLTIEKNYTLNKEEISRDSTKLWISSTMALLMQWSGVLVSGIFLASTQVAYFSTAQRLSMLIGFALMVVNMVNARRYSKLWNNKDIQSMRELSFKSTIYLFLLVTPAILIICIYSDLILQLFGPEYSEASLLFVIMAIGQYINVLTGSVGYILNMSGHYKDFMKLYIFGGMCTVILSLILVNLFSVVGAAIATSIGLISFNLAAVYVVKRRLGFWTFLP
ncbi:oligosaccharide flippase family protein [Paraglaciecola hydrolytica]|uniref:Uncharacterized protein n=1 Tax=Paraglaciecola hydrolytica TaxID=1799789 RepID=A0A148KLM2_9ALTE|nr:oligosaccharide flippase family protein [Paraglaciecola hydrolytica]KXI27224.1 hypothetical protein AX660_21055 [Paraglaciecola hydrolytica]